MKKKDLILDKCVENAIEWIDGDRYVYATVTTKSIKKRIYQIAKINSLMEIVAENKDESILVKFPLKWIKINPGKNTKKEDIKEVQELKEEKPRKKRTLSPEHLAKMQAGRKKSN